MRQIVAAIDQLLLLIDVPEEASVVETCFEHPLIPVLDDALGVAAGVHDGHEVRREFSGFGFDGEIFLVMPHHRGEHFGRQFEISRIEVAADGGGIFGDVSQSFEQICVDFRSELRRFRLDLVRARSCEERMTKFLRSSAS